RWDTTPPPPAGRTGRLVAGKLRASPVTWLITQADISGIQPFCPECRVVPPGVMLYWAGEFPFRRYAGGRDRLGRAGLRAIPGDRARPATNRPAAGGRDCLRVTRSHRH